MGYIKVEDADSDSLWPFICDTSDPYLVIYVDSKVVTTPYYDRTGSGDVEIRDPWSEVIDVPDNKKTVKIKVYAKDYDFGEPDDTFDIYGGSVERYWIEVSYELGSGESGLIRGDGSLDGANELDGIIEFRVKDFQGITFRVAVM